MYSFAEAMWLWSGKSAILISSDTNIRCIHRNSLFRFYLQFRIFSNGSASLVFSAWIFGTSFRVAKAIQTCLAFWLEGQFISPFGIFSTWTLHDLWAAPARWAASRECTQLTRIAARPLSPITNLPAQGTWDVKPCGGFFDRWAELAENTVEI